MIKQFVNSLFIIPLSVILGFAAPVHKLCASESTYHKLSQEGIELAYNMHFDESTAIFDQLIAMQPDNPYGYLLQSVNLYYRYQLEENPSRFEDAFKKTALNAIEHCKKLLITHENKLEILYYLGTVHVYLAAYHGWESNWIKAYTYGKDGIDYLERVVEMAPDYHDAYLGLGLYHYYTDIIPKYVKPLTFLLGIESDREKGLTELKVAAEYGNQSRAEALMFLGSIYLYVEKDYEKSLVYFEKLANLYPENISFLMLLGENYQKVGDHKRAIQTLNHLVANKSIIQFPVLAVSSYFRLGNIYFGLRNFSKAITNYQTMLKLAKKSNQNNGKVEWAEALANLNLGRTYERMGERNTALTYYNQVKKSDHKQAYKLAQERIKSPREVSEDHSASKSFSEIMEMYQSAQLSTGGSRGAPKHSMAEVMYHVAKAFYNKGVYDSAIPKFEKLVYAKKLDSAWIKPWSHYYLASSYYHVGNREKALENLTLAEQYSDPELKIKVSQIKSQIVFVSEK